MLVRGTSNQGKGRLGRKKTGVTSNVQTQWVFDADHAADFVFKAELIVILVYSPDLNDCITVFYPVQINH
eukprot:2069638-Amphidinium_carterae.2